MNTMRALLVRGPGQVLLEEVPCPTPGPYEALVQMEVCGLCNSTDGKLVQGTMYWGPPFPFVLGHESVGRVISVGNRVQKFAVGDRVTRPIYKCAAPGAPQSANGGFAELGVVTDAGAMAAEGDPSLLADYNCERQLVVPPHVSALHAALCISLSETASVLRHLPNPAGRRVAVTGTGVAGLSLAYFLKLAGAHVTVLGRRESRLSMAREMGADITLNTTHPDWGEQLARQVGALDMALEASGDAGLASALLAHLKPDGVASAYGIPPTGETFGARWQTAPVEEHLSFPWLLDLLDRGWLQPEKFISHQFPFAEAAEAFHQSQRGEVLKGFIIF